MGSGFNIALFGLDIAEPVDIQYVKVKQIRHEYDTLDGDEQIYEESPFSYLFQDG
jgi:hypothetical protein